MYYMCLQLQLMTVNVFWYTVLLVVELEVAVVHVYMLCLLIYSGGSTGKVDSKV